jgi:hypothetical protein
MYEHAGGPYEIGDQATMDRMTLEGRQLGALDGSDGIQLTIEETLVMRAVWSTAERVDWAVYEQLRQRVLAWPSFVSPEEEVGVGVTSVSPDLAPAPA